MNAMTTRSIERVSDAETEPEPQGRNIIAVIGIDAYAYWPKLRNAVSDALGVQKLFVEKLGFGMPFPPLLNADATSDNIMTLVTDQLASVLQPNDNVILFYAGHGHTRVNKIGAREIESGYLVPVGAKLENWADKIRTDEFLDNVSQLPARHVLLIIDACRSGFALSGMNAYRSAVTYQETLSRNVSRSVISSARRNEDALDSGPLPNHSLFTGTLIEGLNWGAADLDRNGLVTSYELGLYLQQRVGQASESKQTPDFGSFHLDERGELVISLRDDTFDAVKTRAFAAMLNHDVAALEPLVQQLTSQRPDAAETLYFQFRLRFMQNDYDGALYALYLLSEMAFDEGAIPLTRAEVDVLGVQIAYRRQILNMPPASLPINISLQLENEANEFEDAPRTEFSGGEAYKIAEGATARYAVENTTAAPVHVYILTITPHGRIVVSPLLENEEARIDGLAPGARGYSQKFQISGLPSIVENRIVYAPLRISQLLFANIVATRAPNMGFSVALDEIPAEKVAGMRVQCVYYQIVSPDTHVLWDAVEIRQKFGRMVLDVEEEDLSLESDAGDGEITLEA